ncbi:hypothetical protein ACLOJK_013550 [Asimina triloba]
MASEMFMFVDPEYEQWHRESQNCGTPGGHGSCATTTLDGRAHETIGLWHPSMLPALLCNGRIVFSKMEGSDLSEGLLDGHAIVGPDVSWFALNTVLSLQNPPLLVTLLSPPSFHRR